MRRTTYGSVILMMVIVTLAWSCTSVAPPGSNSGADGTADTSNVEAKDEALKNSLKWTTASEVENFGFDIFRSESEEGPFEKMTGDPLPGAGTTDEPQSYLWEDFDIKRGKDYYYYIESISMAGVREQFSPIIKAPAK